MNKSSGAKIRISEKKTKYFLSFLERGYLRRSQRYGISAIFENFPRIIWKFQLKFVSLHQNNGRVPLLGMGCPRSEELSGSWQLFFLLWKNL